MSYVKCGDRWVSGLMIVRVELYMMSDLYSVLDTVVISGEDVCCSVVFGTLVWCVCV